MCCRGLVIHNGGAALVNVLNIDIDHMTLGVENSKLVSSLVGSGVNVSDLIDSVLWLMKVIRSVNLIGDCNSDNCCCKNQ